MPSSDLSGWDKFRLLLWKNFIIQYNNRLPLVCCIFLPVGFCLPLVLCRSLIDLEDHTVTQYGVINITSEWTKLISNLSQRKATIDSSQQDFGYNHYIPRLIVSYAPNTYATFNKIMELTETFLGKVKVTSFETCDLMREAMSAEYHIAGICFEDTLTAHPDRKFNSYPLQFNFALVFPSELRFYDDVYIGATWQTNTLYGFVDGSFERAHQLAHKDHVAYVREGFLSLQNFVSMAYISLISNRSDLPTISIHRFPYPEHSYDRLTTHNKFTLPLLVVCGLVFPVMYFTTYMVWEKQTHLKVIMRTLGYNNMIHFFAWFVSGLCLLFSSSVLLWIILMVHWNQGITAILTNSSWPLILLFLFSYNVVTMCFCCMISSFFQHSITAITVSGIIWYLTFLPYTMFKYNIISSARVLMYLFSNTAMSFAFDEILDFEEYGNGLTWQTFFAEPPLRDKLSVGTYICIFYVQSIVYTCIGWYVEELNPGLYGIPKKWNHWFMKYKKRKGSISKGKRLTQVIEATSNSKQSVVLIKGLSKDYNEDIVVNEVYFDMHEGDITCLIGHNGCGKTTLISMIVGLRGPTHGTATINGFDIRTQQRFALAGVGVCLRDTVLYNNFTVANQLAFFSRMKGMNEEDVEFEVEKYLGAMKLRDKRNTLTKNLTIGMRQHLAVCCALAGESKVVFLDEADAGMDLASSKLLWQMLLREKKDRTILFTTHSIKAIETLADNVIIMSEGEVTCSGSTDFLKKIYGYGHRLVCLKSSSCNVNNVTELVRQYIPNISPECNLGTELSYVLDDKYNEIFTTLLTDLENNAKSLNLERCAIHESTMEEIFLAMGSEDSSGYDTQHNSDIMNGISIYAEKYERLFSAKYELLGSLQLVLAHCEAMLLKRFAFTKHYTIISLGVQFLAPIIFTVLSILLMGGSDNIEPMTFSLRQYYKTIIIMEAKQNLTPFFKKIENSYRENIFWFNHDHNLKETDELFSTYILEMEKETHLHYKYPIGVTISNSAIVAWFNNFLIHAAPLSLNMVHNAILVATIYDIETPNIKVQNYPLPYKTKYHNSLIKAPNGSSDFLALNLTVCFAFIWTCPVLYIIKERTSRFKLLQLMSGGNLLTLWFSTFVYDLLKVLIITGLIIVTILLLQYNNFKHILVWYFVILLTAGACIKAWIYLLSTMFKDHQMGFGLIATINIFTSVGFHALVDTAVHTNNDHPLQSLANLTTHIFDIFPHFVLRSTLIELYKNYQMRRFCMDDAINNMSIKYEECDALPNCCLDWSSSEIIYSSVAFFLVFTTILFMFLYIIEGRIIRRIQKRFYFIPDYKTESALKEHKRRHELNSSSELEQDVTLEKIKVLSLLPRNYYDKAIVCNRIAKWHGRLETISRLYLIIERGECFGLLGVNGSGKTTLLEMLVGEVELSFGRIFVEGINISSNPQKVYHRIGYSPQQEIVPSEYTGYEVMKILCLLHGIPRPMVKDFCEGLAKVLGFFKYLYKKITVYSSGTKKRIAFSIALLGSPTLLYLDDPISGVDPAGKRQIFNILCKFRSSGKSIVLSAISAQTCEIMCDRVAIISKGRLLCIGTPWSLINKNLLEAYLLEVKITNLSLEKHRRSVVSLSPTLKMISFVENEYPNSVWNDQEGNVLTFLIPTEGNSLSSIFKNIASNISVLNIEHYIITSATLDLAFVELMEQQREFLERESEDVTFAA